MKQETESNTKSLAVWREEIDLLDSELLRLLNQRAAIACKIGAVKVASGLAAYDGRRERQVLARIRAQNPGPFPDRAVDQQVSASRYHQMDLAAAGVSLQVSRSDAVLA